MPIDQRNDDGISNLWKNYVKKKKLDKKDEEFVLNDDEDDL